MATYQYICTNDKCKEKDVEKDCQMSMAEYSEDKLPKCEACGEKTSRVFKATSVRSFEGYRGA